MIQADLDVQADYDEMTTEEETTLEIETTITTPIFLTYICDFDDDDCGSVYTSDPINGFEPITDSGVIDTYTVTDVSSISKKITKIKYYSMLYILGAYLGIKVFKFRVYNRNFVHADSIKS